MARGSSPAGPSRCVGSTTVGSLKASIGWTHVVGASTADRRWSPLGPSPRAWEHDNADLTSAGPSHDAWEHRAQPRTVDHPTCWSTYTGYCGDAQDPSTTVGTLSSEGRDRTIPTCVGTHEDTRGNSTDHPHVRGEHNRASRHLTGGPSHVRGEHQRLHPLARTADYIPCVGAFIRTTKSRRPRTIPHVRGGTETLVSTSIDADHPHVREERCPFAHLRRTIPRAWGAPRCECTTCRTIPTCVGARPVSD